MKKIIPIVALFIFSSLFLFAQSNQQSDMPMQGRGMMGQGMMGRGMMGQGMMHGMHGMSMMGMGDHVIMQLCHFGCPGFLLQFSDEFNLTDNQVSELKSILKKYQKFAASKKADLKIARIELSELLDNIQPNFSQVENKVDEIASVENEIRMEYLDVIEQSRGVLTTEQLKELQKFDYSMGRGYKGQGMMPGGMMRNW